MSYLKTMALWIITAVLTRLPIAMAPLVFIFYGESRFGSYSLGALLTGSFVAGEIAGALLIPLAPYPKNPKTKLPLGLCIATFCLLLLSFISLPWLAYILVCIVGLCTANAPGTLQAMLFTIVPEDKVVRAIAISRMQASFTFTLGPVLASLIYFYVHDITLELVLMSFLTVAALAVFLSCSKDTISLETNNLPLRTSVRVLSLHWRLYATGAGATVLIALPEILLLPLLAERKLDENYLPPLIAIFLIMSLLSPFLYSIRRWKTSHRTQVTLFCVVALAGFCALAVCTTVPLIVLGIIVGGFFVSLITLLRTITLKEALPEKLFSA